VGDGEVAVDDVDGRSQVGKDDRLESELVLAAEFLPVGEVLERGGGASAARDGKSGVLPSSNDSALSPGATWSRKLRNRSTLLSMSPPWTLGLINRRCPTMRSSTPAKGHLAPAYFRCRGRT
jgi:hypothetical protein